MYRLTHNEYQKCYHQHIETIDNMEEIYAKFGYALTESASIARSRKDCLTEVDDCADTTEDGPEASR